MRAPDDDPDLELLREVMLRAADARRADARRFWRPQQHRWPLGQFLEPGLALVEQLRTSYWIMRDDRQLDLAAYTAEEVNRAVADVLTALALEDA